MSNLNVMVQMSKEFSISALFELIDVITLHTIWWPHMHITYHQPQVSSILFMRFLWFKPTVYFAREVTTMILSKKLFHSKVVHSEESVFFFLI